MQQTAKTRTNVTFLESRPDRREKEDMSGSRTSGNPSQNLSPWSSVSGSDVNKVLRLKAKDTSEKAKTSKKRIQDQGPNNTTKTLQTVFKANA